MEGEWCFIAKCHLAFSFSRRRVGFGVFMERGDQDAVFFHLGMMFCKKVGPDAISAKSLSHLDTLETDQLFFFRRSFFIHSFFIR